jgi:hypothetical protein
VRACFECVALAGGLNFDTMDTKTVLTTLTRLASHKPDQAKWLDQTFRGRLEELADPALEVAVETGDPIGQVLAERVAKGGSPVLAKKLMDRCDSELMTESVTLREVAFQVTKISIDQYHTQWPRLDKLIRRRRLAEMLNNLAVRLYALGRYKEAITVGWESVDNFRRLPADHPDSFFAGVVAALNTVALALNAVGRNEEALAAVCEASDSARKLAACQSPKFPWQV